MTERVFLFDCYFRDRTLASPGRFQLRPEQKRESHRAHRSRQNETDLAKRQKIYFELEKVLYDNFEDAWIWWELSIVAFRNTVMGWDNERHIKYREGYDLTHPLWFKDGKPL